MTKEMPQKMCHTDTTYAAPDLLATTKMQKGPKMLTVHMTKTTLLKKRPGNPAADGKRQSIEKRKP